MKDLCAVRNLSSSFTPDLSGHDPVRLLDLSFSSQFCNQTGPSLTVVNTSTVLAGDWLRNLGCLYSRPFRNSCRLSISNCSIIDYTGQFVCVTTKKYLHPANICEWSKMETFFDGSLDNKLGKFLLFFV